MQVARDGGLPGQQHECRFFGTFTHPDQLVVVGDDLFGPDQIGLQHGVRRPLHRHPCQTTHELTKCCVGRRLDSGAPLTGQREEDEPDLTASVNGISVIPPNAHIALARHRTDDEQFLRWPYNYDDPPAVGRTTDSGLIFAAYQRAPATQFVPVQERLAAGDAFNRWITTIGSAVFAILPGVDNDGCLGQSLLS